VPTARVADPTPRPADTPMPQHRGPTTLL
jgi:hypothetical protein